MALLDRHLTFVEALREAGLPVSLAEGLDAVTALGVVGWDERELVRAAYAATVVKKQSQRDTFDAIFDLWFPALIGEGAGAESYLDTKGQRDTPAQLADLRERVALELERELREQEPDGDEASSESASGDGVDGEGTATTAELAIEAVGRFGRMPGRAPGQQGWSGYNTMRRLGAEQLVQRLAEALRAAGVGDREARVQAEASVARFERAVAVDAMRRLAAERDPSELARTTVRPTIEKLEFTSARAADLDAMRRALLPLARRLAVRLTKEQCSRRRGPLDFRRTVRASMATGGVPLETHQRSRRPHRTDLVVLCDVSGSVSSFAQFTLMLVFALREQFTGVRAFTFVDDVHEVSDLFVPGADPGEVLTELAARSAQSARFGRTNYGAAFKRFTEQHADAISPRATLLILGDARSNYADLNEAALAGLSSGVKQAYWLNPEHRRHWGTGDSAAWTYGEVVPMTECRNLEQLAAFVHDLV